VVEILPSLAVIAMASDNSYNLAAQVAMLPGMWN